MAYHTWGDGFDFEGLYKAIDLFCNTFHEKAGVYPCVKEKYGTMRIEMEFLWLNEKKNIPILWDSLRTALEAYPQFREELLDEVEFILDREEIPEDLRLHDA